MRLKEPCAMCGSMTWCGRRCIHDVREVKIDASVLVEAEIAKPGKSKRLRTLTRNGKKPIKEA